MMPTCGFKLFGFFRCNKVAEINIGEIVTTGKDGFGKPLKQTHYLCRYHHIELLSMLGFKTKED